LLLSKLVRIAIVSTPFVPVPPPLYGGTELIVAELAAGLAARGHDVTLFATGDSRPHARVHLRSLFPRAMWPPEPYVELAHAAFAVENVLGDRRGFDVVHAHVPSVLAFDRLADVPIVYTVHHELDPRLSALYTRARASLVAISARQRELCRELARAAVVHHGLTPARYPLGRGDGRYAVFLGRLSREKGPHHAIDATARAGVALRIGGLPHWRDEAYYAREVAPRLARASHVTLAGEIGGHDKARLLGDACALLFPIEWEEPFGLVMIEAMLCGTPVLAFDHGSVREVVDDGVTGFVCDGARDLAARLRAVTRGGFDRHACRERARARFSAERMVNDYERLYLSLLGFSDVDQRAAAPLA
jgi:glycosyltransferase involved in cell wall biosynthesis